LRRGARATKTAFHEFSRIRERSQLSRVDGLLKSNKPQLAADLAEREKALIEEALRESEGGISGPAGAAARLGIPRQTLESKIKKLGINRRHFRA